MTRAGRANLFILPIALALCCAAAPSGPATRPATTAPALWARLSDIDARAGRIKTLSAAFEQQKFTAMLRRPLVSSGRVRVSGARMRWDTLKPDPNVLVIDPREAKVYYPDRQTLEIYPLDQRLGELAASPLPRLDVLKAHFTFEQLPTASLDKSVDPKRFLALQLVPSDPSLAEHIRHVRVLLDAEAGCIVRAEVTDSDGDRTVMAFSAVQTNGDVGDLEFQPPRGTTVTRPLAGLDGAPPERTGGTSK